MTKSNADNHSSYFSNHYFKDYDYLMDLLDEGYNPIQIKEIVKVGNIILDDKSMKELNRIYNEYYKKSEQ
tara:strand:- start:212 stop:421 length:210 start_codon:yes stop_codon:yes gene_type:complete